MIQSMTRQTIPGMLELVFLILAILHSVNSQTTVRYCGNTPADVVFLLDSSNSMWGPDFIQQLDFVSNVTQMFDIGETATQVGLATFNDDVQLQFYLHEYWDKERLLRAIGQVQQTYGISTATDQALKFLRTRFFHSRYGARRGVPHIAIVITDGQSDRTLRTLIEATKAKRHNINIFTIGVGKHVNSLELERMASSPSKEYAFVVDSFSFLDSIKEKLAIKTCSVTAPPTILSTTVTTATPATTLETTTTPVTTTASTMSATITSPSSTRTTTATITSTLLPTTTSTSTTTTSTSATTTTIPETTTTTIPLPTTTTWVDIVRKICERKSVDVVFALDSSEAVSPKDFWYQVKFVRDFTLGLDVSVNRTRVGVVLFSDTVVRVFDVNDHTSLSSAISDLYRIERRHTGTGARIDKLIHYVRTKSFRRTISRREAAQLLVLITANGSENLHEVKKEANKARSTGINMLVVGVGNKVNPEELSIITGAEGHKRTNTLDDFMPYLESSSSRRRQIFHPESFADLDNIVMQATIEACTAEVAPVPVSDQACGTRQGADMVFVMDSASAGKKNTKKSLDFIKHVTQAVDVSDHTVQIGMLQPEDCIPRSQSFGLNSHSDKNHVVSALELPAEQEKLSSLLKNLRKNSFKRKKGGRKDAKKIAVVLVDGELQQPLRVLEEAKLAEINGIEVYVIFVGRDPPQPEVRDMCAYPPGKHFFQVPDYDRLKDLEESLIELLCDEL